MKLSKKIFAFNIQAKFLIDNSLAKHFEIDIEASFNQCKSL